MSILILKLMLHKQKQTREKMIILLYVCKDLIDNYKNKEVRDDYKTGTKRSIPKS